MALLDDYFDLASELKGEQRRKLRRIWAAFCAAEADVDEARECMRLVNSARLLLADKPALFQVRKVAPKRQKKKANERYSQT